ncbi:MAG: hypothetical protein ACKPKO_61245, partial [Candidatus Fonsibacter sp.]
INGAAYSASKATIPEGNYSTITLAQAMADEMNKKYPFGVMPGVTPPACTSVNISKRMRIIIYSDLYC